MKKIFLVLFLSAVGMLLHAQNGLEQIYVERYYVSDAIDAANSNPTLPLGSVTYRIYADLLPGYKVQSIYGSPQHPLTMNTTTTFFNQADNGSSTPAFTATAAKENTTMLDSWLSTGAACTGYLGIPKTDDNGVGTFVNSGSPQLLQNNSVFAGIPLTSQDGMIAGSVPTTTFLGLGSAVNVFGDGTTIGNSFYITNGAWACLNGASGPVPATNKVLIAQITTDGTFHFELNIQIGTPSLGTQKYVSSGPTGDEITIPSLTQTLHAVPAPPAVSVTSPVAASTFGIGSAITFTADASDIEGTVAQVQFFVDGNPVGVLTGSPYTLTYSGSTQGSHVVTATATDNYGQTANSAPVSYNVTSNKILNLTLFMESLYSGPGVMRKAQGSSGDQFPANTADRLTVEFHDAAVPATVVYAFSNVDLLTNGMVSVSTVPSTLSGSYYIVIKHRNSIETWSAAPVSFSGTGSVSYDFSSSAAQAFGSNLKSIGAYYAVYGGDSNQDGIVDGSDMAAIDNASTSLLAGYNSEDINGDGIVDGSDMALIDNNSTSLVQAIRP
ncbi:MAG: hypothetical protein HXX13_11925 [Bacteroidetes bacterium]|nr:hypothetical protein [Bacteroidota bacterium]